MNSSLCILLFRLTNISKKFFPLFNFFFVTLTTCVSACEHCIEHKSIRVWTVHIWYKNTMYTVAVHLLHWGSLFKAVLRWAHVCLLRAKALHVQYLRIMSNFRKAVKLTENRDYSLQEDIPCYLLKQGELTFVHCKLKQAFWYYAMVWFRTIYLKSHPIAQFTKNRIIHKRAHIIHKINHK